MARTRPPAIALDLDGTLIDARPRQVGVAAEALAWASAASLDEARFWRFKRAGASTRGALLQLGYPEAVAERAAARWANRVESPDWLARDRALPGVAAALRRLRAADCEVTVITARRVRDGAVASVRAAGLEPLVHGLRVVDPGDAAAAKSDVLRELGAPPFIGDSESDGDAAARAEVRFVAVASGQRSRGYLARRGLIVADTLAGALRALDAPAATRRA